MGHRVDLHIHSCYSLFDGLMSPRAVVKLAAKLGIDAVSVTDHYTHDRVLRGTVAAHKLAPQYGVVAYKGLEYSVTQGPDRGHVLLYFDHEDQVPARGLALQELVDHCRAEGLTLTHPHPFGFAGIRSLDLMREADHVELNGSYGRGPVNERLLQTLDHAELAHKLVANSDAHARGQMGAAYTAVDAVHETVADTLATKQGAALGEPKRSWGRAAKITRAVVQPVGLAMNAVQKGFTHRAVRRADAMGPATPVTD